MILLDTHVAIWIATESAAMGRESRKIAQRALAEDELAISAISFWEIALLVTKGRFAIWKPAAELRQELFGTGVVELPINGEIAILAADFENLHADPTDRFIAATAIIHNATLMTADARLLRWRHKLPRQNAAR